MQDSPQKTSKVGRNIVLFLLAFVFLIVALFYSCIKSSPRITVSNETPVTFYTKGNNEIVLFQITNNSKIIWKLYPKGKNLSLRELSTVRYAEIPSSCEQVFPRDLSVPTPLIEGETYTALLQLLGSSGISVTFKIENGKVITIDENYPLKGKF